MKFLHQKTLAVVFLTTFFNNAWAQNKGVVYSEKNLPIPNVSIFFNSEKVAETDTQGIFALSEALKLPINLRLVHPDYFISEVEMKQNNSTFQLSPLLKSENLDEIIVSSTNQKDTSAGSATIIIIPTEKITAEKFDQYSPIDLVSAINETPGVFIQSGAINTNRITIRGVGSRTLYGTNKIRAYFNGIPITNGIGETAIDIFDPEDLQSLEIIKGPKATQYGTNLGGTLLLNSKQAAVGESFLKSNLTIGSFGLIKNSVSAATSTEKLSLNLNYDHLETEGFRENSDYNRKTLLLNSTYKFNFKNELSLLVNYVDYLAQIPSSIGKTAFEEDPSQAAFTWKAAQGFEDNKQTLVGLSFTHRFSEKFSNTSSIFYTYLDHYEPRPFNILDEFTNGYGARTVFAKDFIFLNNKANLSFGGEFYKDEYNWETIANLYKENNGNGSLEGDLLSDNIEKRNNLNAFATVTIPFTEKFKGQFGLNFNKTNYSFNDEFNQGEADKSADRDFDPIFAPNVNLLYQFTENLSSYLNFSRGFNYPSIEETLTPEGVINPELGPEKGFNYEVGSEFFLFKRKLHFQVNAYLLDIDDLLVAEREGDDQYIGRNAGKTEHKGLEMSISYNQSINKFIYVSPYLNAEITDHKFIDFMDGNTDFSGNQLTGVPQKKVNGGINFGFKNLSLITNFLHIGEIPLNDSNALYSEKYTVFNAKASYKKELSKQLSLEINAGINNFTDEKYAASVLINATGFGNSEPRYYYPGRPRNWFGGVKIGFRL
ncbi:TonB-dependent receptor family protein [Aequorivita lipolytica]|uniref:TonB-dependent receptor n=1 Tax=Aequorivita lipolytica TaxID=153267 RepID=A0A5C6YKX7_9FLAO|nr:TonB-dependent receptor [Aequorivita lipolytica]TXD68038.1 TonB-dependent receptor [Aequorivita lipolytica]SRX53668.1 Vitamin B12 transporter BtuB [Aequorivita lipolytica]